MRTGQAHSPEGNSSTTDRRERKRQGTDWVRLLAVCVVAVCLYWFLMPYASGEGVKAMWAGIVLRSALIVPVLAIAAFFVASTKVGGAISSFCDRIFGANDRRIAVVLFVTGVAVANVTAAWVHQHAPGSLDVDENSYLFQAKVMKRGDLWVPTPSPRESFLTVHVVMADKTYGKYPPGHPFVLMLGLFLGSPYVITSILAGLTPVFVFFAARALYDKKTAVLAGILLALCPFFWVISGMLLSQVSSLFFLSLGLLLYAKATRRTEAEGGGPEAPRTSPWAALGCGAALAMAFTCRPYSTTAFSIPLIIGAIWLMARRKMPFVRFVIPALVGVIPFLFLFLLYNHQLTGDWLTQPFNVYWPADRPGFGEELGIGEFEGGEYYVGNSPLKGLRYIFIQTGTFNESAGLFWPATVFVVLATFLWRRKSWADWVLMGVFATIPAFYFFYHSPASFFQGPLYYYEMLIPLMILLARGIMEAPNRLRSAVGSTPSRVAGFALTALVISLVARFFVPTGVGETQYGETKAFNRNLYYLKMIRLQTTTLVDFRKALQSEDAHNAVVFMPPTTGIFAGYGCDIGPLIYVNEPDFAGDIVYALDLSDEQNQKVMERYAGREFFAWRPEYEGGPPRLIPLHSEGSRGQSRESRSFRLRLALGA